MSGGFPSSFAFFGVTGASWTLRRLSGFASSVSESESVKSMTPLLEEGVETGGGTAGEALRFLISSLSVSLSPLGPGSAGTGPTARHNPSQASVRSEMSRLYEVELRMEDRRIQACFRRSRREKR